MDELNRRGWTEPLRAYAQSGRPLFGICIGMQLMAETGRERGVHQGLGWIAGEVVPIEPEPSSLKVPHMGWNELEVDGLRHPLLKEIAPGDHVYFVHGYHLVCARASERLASVNYGGTISAMVGRDNMAGTQFHPEKSQRTGLRLIANFLSWRP